MTEVLYQSFFMNALGLILFLMSGLAIKQSWKDGNFTGASLFCGILFFALAALSYQWMGRFDISLALLGLSALLVLFTIFVVFPMAMRRRRKKIVS